jgi:hypothetical protein
VLSVAKSAFGGWLKLVSICVNSWLKNKPKSQAAYNERKYIINNELSRSAKARKKNKANLLLKILIFEPKTDDTKLYKNMQNKANWKMTQMFVTKVLTNNYNSWTLSARGKNKAKTKPICFLKT